MKSTSVRYLLTLLLSSGVPLACSSTTGKTTSPGDQGEAGASAGGDPHGSGGSKTQPGGDGGAGDGAQAGGDAAAGSGGTSTGGTSTGGDAGAGMDGGGQPVGGDNAGGEAAGGAGGNDGGVLKTPVDPTLDGADDASSGRYRLRFKPTQKCLSTLDGLLVAACANDTAQQFFLDGAGQGFVRVRGVSSDTCVGSNGSAIEAVVCSEDAKLELVPTGGGYFNLLLPNDSCLGMLDGALAQVACGADTLWSLDSVGTNFALKAKFSATSTFPGYSTDYAHDGDRNTGLSGHSWANNWQPPQLVLPQEVTIDFGAARQFSQINVLTSQNYEIGSYDIDYWNGSGWTNLVVVKDNVQLSLTHTFPTLVASKLRFLVRRGPEAQFIYTRLNEVEIF